MIWTDYLAIVLRWEDEHTVGLAYYGLDPTGRNRFKRRRQLTRACSRPCSASTAGRKWLEPA